MHVTLIKALKQSWHKFSWVLLRLKVSSVTSVVKFSFQDEKLPETTLQEYAQDHDVFFFLLDLFRNDSDRVSLF